MADLTTILTNMEGKSIGKYLGTPGLFECGMDNFDNPLRKMLKRL